MMAQVVKGLVCWSSPSTAKLPSLPLTPGALLRGWPQPSKEGLFKERISLCCYKGYKHCDNSYHLFVTSHVIRGDDNWWRRFSHWHNILVLLHTRHLTSSVFYNIHAIHVLWKILLKTLKIIVKHFTLCYFTSWTQAALTFQCNRTHATSYSTMVRFLVHMTAFILAIFHMNAALFQTKLPRVCFLF